MIPMMNIIAWSASAPWAEIRQVEQDLIISRALIELFGDPMLAHELRLRGGTALHKLLLPRPLRYSEDIDLVRTTAGPIGPILDRSRERLEPWLGHATFEQSITAPKLRFRVPAEDGTGDIRLKVEINKGRSRLSILHMRSVTVLRIRGLREEQSFRPFHARNCSRRSCAHSCSVTRGATCSIFSRRSKHSRFWTTDA